MSTRKAIRDCVDGGELVRLRPKLPGVLHMREVFATPLVQRFVYGMEVPQALTKKAADCRAALDRFMAGAITSVAMDPMDKASYAELARIEPQDEGMWAFRIRDPKPQVRIFGGFAERDVFVAVDYRQRDRLDFDAAGLTARVLWNDLFDEYEPLKSDTINGYLSDKYREV